MTEPSEFLRRDGTVQLLCVMDGNGHRYSELEEQVLVTDNTLTKRLGEGEDLGIFRRKLSDEGATLYTISGDGDLIRREIEKRGTNGVFQSYKSAHDNFNENVSELAEWFEERPPSDGLDKRRMIMIDWLEEEARHSERYDLDEFDSLEALLGSYLRSNLPGLHDPIGDVELAIEHSSIDSIEELREGDEE